MKARQLKKNLRKAIELLNELDVEDYDFDSEGILYINIEDTQQNRGVLNRICSLMKLNRYGIFHDMEASKEDFSPDDEPQIDLGYLIGYLRTPKNLDLFFNVKKGFSLKRRLDQFC